MRIVPYTWQIKNPASIAGLILFQIVYEEDHYEDEEFYYIIEDLQRKFDPYARFAKKKRILKILIEKNLEEVFKKLWNKWWLDSLTTEDFIELIENRDCNLLEQLLKNSTSPSI